MTVGTSALFAIFFGEPEADDFVLAIREADMARLSVASYVEAGVRLFPAWNPRSES